MIMKKTRSPPSRDLLRTEKRNQLFRQLIDRKEDFITMDKNLNINFIELTGKIRDDLKCFENGSGRLVQFQIECTDPDSNKNRRNIFPCVAWNDRADKILGKFRKGDKIHIIGKLFSNNYRYEGTKYISYGVQIWLDFCEPIDGLNSTDDNHADGICPGQEKSVGDEDELYNGQPLPF